MSQISIIVSKLSSTMEDKQFDFGTNNSSSAPYPSKNLEFPYHQFNYFSLSEILLSLCWLYGTKYSRMDQCGKLVEQPLKNLNGCGLFKACSFKFLKVIFHKFYLVYSWILCLIQIMIPIRKLLLTRSLPKGFQKQDFYAFK